MSYKALDAQIDEFFKIAREKRKTVNDKKDETQKFRGYLKNVYDYTRKTQQKHGQPKSRALPKLIIENMDTEQIWQQLELMNTEFLPRNEKKLESILSQNASTNYQLSENQMETEEESDDSEIEAENGDLSENEELEEDMSFEEDDIEGNTDSSQVQKKSYPKSVVDDEFFNLKEMEEFLISNEKEVERGSDDSEEEEVNEYLFFAGDDDEKEYEKAITAKFKDYFRPNEEKNTNEKLSSDELSEEEMKENSYSNFELRKERIQKKIDRLEDNAVAEKPWMLKGEIRADSRPMNSLLEEDVEFDRTTRPAPIVTGATTVRLEDIIRQRIKDKAFDDPQRRHILEEKPVEYKKTLVLSQEKSKESLAQIYEKSYLEQKAGILPDHDGKEEESELHKKVKSAMKSLFSQLDALSNYHYTPKPAMAEVKIVKNVRALNSEEVGPVVISDAMLMTPKEVKENKELLGKSELTKTDKKRKIRQKKAKLKKLNKGKDDKIKDKKDPNVKKMTQNKNMCKSSKAFFQEIEEKQKMLK